MCYFQEALIQVRTAAAQAIGQLGDVGAKVLCDRLHGAETGWEEKIVILEAFARLDIEEYKFKKRGTRSSSTHWQDFGQTLRSLNVEFVVFIKIINLCKKVTQN